MEKRITARELHEEWMKNPDYARAYEALDEELALAEAFIHARAELTQEQVAERMGTTQAAVARPLSQGWKAAG